MQYGTNDIETIGDFPRVIQIGMVRKAHATRLKDRKCSICRRVMELDLRAHALAHDLGDAAVGRRPGERRGEEGLDRGQGRGVEVPAGARLGEDVGPGGEVVERQAVAGELGGGLGKMS